jgi:hypothetical protein
MRLPKTRHRVVLLAVVPLAVVLLCLPGCGGADQASLTSTRDPNSATDQVSIQLTAEEARALEAACRQEAGVPGVSDCPDAVEKVVHEAGTRPCTAQSDVCMTLAAAPTDGATGNPPETTAEVKTAASFSCPRVTSCRDIIPDLANGITLSRALQVFARALPSSSPPTTSESPTTDSPTADSPTTDSPTASTEAPSTTSSSAP